MSNLYRIEFKPKKFFKTAKPYEYIVDVVAVSEADAKQKSLPWAKAYFGEEVIISAIRHDRHIDIP